MRIGWIRLIIGNLAQKNGENALLIIESGNDKAVIRLVKKYAEEGQYQICKVNTCTYKVVFREAK